MSQVSQITVVAPNMAQQIIDAAIQMHDCGRLPDDCPQHRMLPIARGRRLADAPDEAHRGLIA